LFCFEYLDNLDERDLAFWTREASLAVITDNLRDIQNYRISQIAKTSDYKRAIYPLEQERNRILANKTHEDMHDDMWNRLKKMKKG